MTPTKVTTGDVLVNPDLATFAQIMMTAGHHVTMVTTRDGTVIDSAEGRIGAITHGPWDMPGSFQIVLMTSWTREHAVTVHPESWDVRAVVQGEIGLLPAVTGGGEPFLASELIRGDRFEPLLAPKLGSDRPEVGAMRVMSNRAMDQSRIINFERDAGSAGDMTLPGECRVRLLSRRVDY